MIHLLYCLLCASFRDNMTGQYISNSPPPPLSGQLNAFRKGRKKILPKENEIAPEIATFPCIFTGTHIKNSCSVM